MSQFSLEGKIALITGHRMVLVTDWQLLMLLPEQQLYLMI